MPIRKLCETKMAKPTSQPQTQAHAARPWRRLWLCAAALVAGCASPPPPPPPQAQAPLPPPVPQPLPVTEIPTAPPLPGQVSEALTPRDYRRDAATHLYQKQRARIYPGKMPPLLYAVGVLQVDIDGRGQVTDIRWMRAPTQAPEVMADIERSVRAAAPFPAPVKMGRVTYTDTWLWHKSGRFQLDTLTEGQL